MYALCASNQNLLNGMRARGSMVFSISVKGPGGLAQGRELVGFDRVVESLHCVGRVLFAARFALVFPGTVAEDRSVGGMNASRAAA